MQRTRPQAADRGAKKMAYDDYREGDRFSVDFRMAGQMKGCWHLIGETATLDEACAMFDGIVASDRAESRARVSPRGGPGDDGGDRKSVV